MMDSEDEDIIFENSALHQALLDSGLTNVETQPRVEMAQENSVLNSDARNDAGNMNGNVDNGGNKHSFLIRLFLPTNSLQLLRSQKMNVTLQHLISSKLISEEDRFFFQFFINDEEQPSQIDPSEVLTVWSLPLKIILGLTFLLFNICAMLGLLRWWVILLLDLNPSLLGFQPYAQVISMPLAILFWVFLILIPVMKIKSRVLKKVMNQLETGDKMVQDLEKEAWELMYLEKKCFRLIKESELVARGFTIASHQRLASGHGDTDTPLDRWCPELRETMLTGNMALMAEIKKNVVKMMRGVPMVTKDSDFNTLEEMTSDENNSNCVEKLKEREQNLHPSKSSVPCQNQQAESMTKDRNKETSLLNRIVPPARVNKSVTLLSLYISGFIRRLALCFNVQNFKDQSLDPYEVTQGCIENCKLAMEKVRSVLNQSYTFYRAVHQASERSGCPTVSEWSRANEQSPIYKLYVCVNSLDLHLQSVLQVTRDLTLTLEKRLDAERRKQNETGSTENSEQGVSAAISIEDKQSWEAILKQVKTSLESCKMCHDESLKQLCQKPDPEIQTSESVNETKVTSNQQQQPRVRIVPAEDPVIVDQVFEALVEEGDDEDVTMSRPRYTAEDRARIQEQRETMKKLRQEIQSVIGVRAISQRAREEKALARARGEESGETQVNQEQTTSQTSPDSLSARETTSPILADSQELLHCNREIKEEQETVAERPADKKSALNCDGPVDLSGMITRGRKKKPKLSVDRREQMPGSAVEQVKLDNNRDIKEELETSIDRNSGLNCDDSVDLSAMITRDRKKQSKPSVDERELMPSSTAAQVKSNKSLTSPVVSNIETEKPMEDKSGKTTTGLLNGNSESKTLPRCIPNVKGNVSESMGNVNANGQPGKSSSEDDESVSVSGSKENPGSSKTNLLHATGVSNGRNSQVLENGIETSATGHRMTEKDAKTNSHDGVNKSLICKNSKDKNSDGESQVDADRKGLNMSAGVSVPSRTRNGECMETPHLLPGEIISNKKVVVTAPSSSVTVSETGLAGHLGPADTLGHITPLSTSTSSSSSQIICPRHVDKEKEGFRKVGDVYVSRHNFTPSGCDAMLREALSKLENASQPLFHQEASLEIDPPDPQRRNSAETDNLESDKWVKITHQKYTTTRGNKIEMLRQKEIHLEDVLSQPVIASPDANSSFTKSIALLAAARAKNFTSSTQNVEEFGDLDSDSDE